MIKEWRPDGWATPRYTVTTVSPSKLTNSDASDLILKMRLYYEQGASAMLAALREIGTHYNNDVFRGKGTGVFIPDDQEEFPNYLKIDYYKEWHDKGETFEECCPEIAKASQWVKDNPPTWCYEEGYFCPRCGLKIPYNFGSYWVFNGKHKCKANRGIS